MRLLYLSHCVPFPPNKGEKLRAYHTLRFLSRSHDLHLLALSKGSQDLIYQDQLEEICRKVEIFPLVKAMADCRSLAGLLGRRPLTHAFYRSRRLARRVAEMAKTERFDAVVVFSSAMAPYAVPFEETARMIDLGDVDSEKWRQYSRFSRFPKSWVYRLESRRLRAFEQRVAQQFAGVIVVSLNELNLLELLAPQSNGAVVRMGVDLDYFKARGDEKHGQPSIVFTGQMDYFPNVDGIVHFALEIFPLLREKYSKLQLFIVGRRPTQRVKALADRPGIVVTGAVDDIRPYLAGAWVFVAPLRIAQGVQNKVLEAMAMGLPVVCSRKVFDGLEDGGFEAGRELLVAERTEDYVHAVVRLIEEPGLRDRMSSEATDRLDAAYDWEQNMGRFERFLLASVQQFSRQ